MHITNKGSGKAMSMPGGLTLGVLISLILTILLTAVFAKMIEAELLEEDKIGYGAMLTLTLSAFCGAVTASSKIKHQHLMVCIYSGILSMALLMGITALFFGGQYEAVGVTALMILCGTGLAILAIAARNNKGRNRKVRIPNR